MCVLARADSSRWHVQGQSIMCKSDDHARLLSSSHFHSTSTSVLCVRLSLNPTPSHHLSVLGLQHTEILTTSLRTYITPSAFNMRASQTTWRANTTATLLVVALIQCSYSYTSGATDYERPEKRDLEALKRTIDRLDDSVTHDLPHLPSLESYHEVVDSDLSSELIFPETEYNSSPTANVPSRDTSLDPAKIPNPFAKSPYQLSRQKGQYLLSLLENPTCAPPTPFTQFSDLQSWGWTYQMGGNVLSILGSLASIMTRYAGQ